MTLFVFGHATTPQYYIPLDIMLQSPINWIKFWIPIRGPLSHVSQQTPVPISNLEQRYLDNLSRGSDLCLRKHTNKS